MIEKIYLAFCISESDAVSISGPASFQKIENVIQMSYSPGLRLSDKDVGTLAQNV